MKKMLPLFIALLPVIGLSQNLKKEKVKTSTLEYPKIDLGEHSLESIKVDFCTAALKFQSKKSKKEGALCKNQLTKKMVTMEVYRYNCVFLSAASYVRVKSATGEVLYMDMLTEPKEVSYTFAKKNCFATEKQLESSYSKDKATFESKSSKEDHKSKYDLAKGSVGNALFFMYAAEEFGVHYPKSKNHDYSDLAKAAEIAADGFKAMKGKPGKEADASKLKEAIAIWDKALEDSNPDDKTSRINKKVTLAVLENKARAYGYMFEFDKALQTIRKALAMEGNFSNNKTLERKRLKANLENRAEAYTNNKDLPVSLKKKSVSVKAQSAGSFASFESDYRSYSRVPIVKYNPNTGSGDKDNPLRPLVMDNGTDVTLMIPSLGAGLAGLPQYGKKIDKFPEDICRLTDVTSLILRGNRFTSIPACIGNMSALKKLNLANNQLISLPDEIGNLEALKTLILKGNSIPQAEINKIQEMLPDCKIKL